MFCEMMYCYVHLNAISFQSDFLLNLKRLYFFNSGNFTHFSFSDSTSFLSFLLGNYNSLSCKGVRSLSSSEAEPVVVVPLITDSLEWTLSSPPPLHQFLEPPLFIETDHLTLSPGTEVEEILKAQGEEVSEVKGLENWEAQGNEADFEGKIPQNAEWTEFITEKK